MKKTGSNKRVVVIPVFNEEQKIIDILSACEGQMDIFVIINDGSADRSGEIINSWKQGKDNVYLICSQKNRGMSWAVKEGFRFIHHNRDKLGISDDDIIIQVDADAQHSVHNINELIDYMERNQIEYLVTRRTLKGYPLIKIIGNRLMSIFASILTFRRFYDIECGYRLVKVKVIQRLLFYTVGFKYSWAQEMAVICARLGFKIDNRWETETNYYRRRGTRFIDALINCLFSSLVLHINFCLKKLSNIRCPDGKNYAINEGVE